MDPQQQQQQQVSPPTTGNRSHSASGGGRDDCWSEDASKTLIDAWGERYLHLNRGNLRQKDWKEVALAVNSRNHGLKPPRTDVQCKNRIDTLKKKYKLEKSRPSSSASNWLFYNRLHYLIGNNGNSLSTSIPDPKLSTTTLTLTIKPISKSITNPSSSPNQFSAAAGDDDDDDDDDDEDTEEFVRRVSRKERAEETPPYKELARAILRFGEIYERIESSKQQQLMELEKQRMEFTKDLEFQRINMFTEAHLQLQKKKRKKPINNHTPPPPASVKKL